MLIKRSAVDPSQQNVKKTNAENAQNENYNDDVDDEKKCHKKKV